MAWNNLAAIAFLQDSTDLAMEYTIHAVESDPTNTAAAFNAATLCHDKGLFDQALTLYRKAIDIDTTFAAAYSALGSLYNDMKRPVEAIVTLDRSLVLAPLSPYNYLIYKNLAEAHYLLKQYDKAFGYLEQSKELEPDYPETQMCYARYYEATGDIPQSISHWQKYLVMETDSILLAKANLHLDSLKGMK
jgi:tetratricopeptide (TPR) repeat protein